MSEYQSSGDKQYAWMEKRIAELEAEIANRDDSEKAALKWVAELEAELAEVKERVEKSLGIAENGQIDGDHHKMWVIDQIVRTLTGPRYDEWIREYEKGEDGPDTYWWEEGIAP